MDTKNAGIRKASIPTESAVRCIEVGRTAPSVTELGNVKAETKQGGNSLNPDSFNPTHFFD
jgi:hypothetical protein